MSFFPFEVAALEWDEMAPNSRLLSGEARSWWGAKLSPHPVGWCNLFHTYPVPHLPSAPTWPCPPSCDQLGASNHPHRVICANRLRPLVCAQLANVSCSALTQLLPPGHIHPATPTGLSPPGHNESSVQTRHGLVQSPRPCSIRIELATVSHPILL